MPKGDRQGRLRSDPGLFASENRTLSVQCPLGMVVPVADLTDYQDSPSQGGYKPPCRGRLLRKTQKKYHKLTPHPIGHGEDTVHD